MVRSGAPAGRAKPDALKRIGVPTGAVKSYSAACDRRKSWQFYVAKRFKIPAYAGMTTQIKLSALDLYFVARFLGFVVKHFRRKTRRQYDDPGLLF